MTLNIAVVKTPPGVSLAENQKNFGENGGSIGRGSSNTWVLDDPDRFLSSKHCELSFEGGQYYLTDMSTNGTFVNGSPEPVGKGGKVALSNGDIVELGDYQFKVELNAAFSSAPASKGPDPFASGSDPFSGGGNSADPFASDPFGSANTDPLAPNNADPFASDPFGGNSSDPFAGNSQPDPFSKPDPFDSADPFGGGGDDPFAPAPGQSPGQSLEQGGDFGMGSDSENVDPLKALDNANFGNTSDVFGSGKSDPAPHDDMFANSGTHSDGADPMGQSVQWPESQSGGSGGIIPDDWGDDLFGSSTPAPVTPAPPMPSQPTPPQPTPSQPTPPQPKPPEEDFHRSMPLTDPPKTPRPQSKPALEEPLMAERKPEAVEPFRAPEKKPEQVQPEPEPRAEPARPQPARPATPAGSSKAGHMLLDAMGLADRNLSDAELEEISELVGKLMPVIVTGMMQVLRSRTSIKNEFRMNVTTIQPVENNPLKFSATPQEAIENMFVRKSSAYKNPVDSFREGFDGIGEHQVAIIAGIRAAFKGMMDSFDPSRLEQQFDRQNKGVALPGMQKARYWSSYTEYFQGFVDNMENSFQYLFGDVFVEAYEEQLRKLAAERKR